MFICSSHFHPLLMSLNPGGPKSTDYFKSPDQSCQVTSQKCQHSSLIQQTDDLKHTGNFKLNLPPSWHLGELALVVLACSMWARLKSLWVLVHYLNFLTTYSKHLGRLSKIQVHRFSYDGSCQWNIHIQWSCESHAL